MISHRLQVVRQTRLDGIRDLWQSLSLSKTCIMRAIQLGVGGRRKIHHDHCRFLCPSCALVYHSQNTIMGLVHIPRVLASVARGYLRPQAPLAGVGLNQPPHVYHSRVGLLDFDSFGHLNNAQYLTHAEYARWNMTSSNGFLRESYQSKLAFLVTGAQVRYRRDIPAWNRFVIETHLLAVDERTLYLRHNFRRAAGERILAQVMIEAVLARGKTIVDPRDGLRALAQVTEKVLQSLELPLHGSAGEVLEQSRALDEALKAAAAEDDELLSR